ncbi:MAG TPA: Maf family nucleotide pyrophosphatase [Burkholderiaceae bacterium]|nr:Maf family nucleotide pyrophosphatase [Burkholderiaceae bacterium]
MPRSRARSRVPRIVLASTSPYRRELLSRLRVAFDVVRPDIDEAALADEAPRETALRLAQAKARAVAGTITDALVIGSDQVADLDGQALGKPGSHPAALAQLELMQGRTIVFHTAVALLDARSGAIEADCVPTRVRFRSLPRAALDAYLRADQPYDCAGAAKIEALGITLVESVHADDPTALIGLPLIRLTSMLLRAGIVIPPR